MKLRPAIQRALFLTCICIYSFNTYGQQAVAPSVIRVDLAKSEGKLPPMWAFFGYDEPNYTYMKDGKKLLSELAALSPVPVNVRVHNLLTTGDGTPNLKWGSTNAYTEDAAGKPVYNWRLVDSIFDTFVQRGMKPIAQIGFMPEALSVTPEHDGVQTTPDRQKVKHYTGWAYPPKDHQKWAELVYQWVKHSVKRYGKAEVESWYWELWNEPDISYWKGSTEDYIKMYDYTADAVKRALLNAKIGGPETTNPGSQNAGNFLKTFLEHIVNGKNYATGKKGAPLDFITFHAKGEPKVIDGTVWMNMGVQLRHIDRGFEIIASFPTLKNLPVIIGESDPEGCAACSEEFFPPNAYRNSTMYSSYTAASFARKYDLAKSRGINLAGAVTWAFEFEGQPYFRGFRDLATNGIDKPVLNVFRMFGMMQGDRVEVTSGSNYNYMNVRDSSVRGAGSDINALATKNKNYATVLVWNYHDKNDVNVSGNPVTIKLAGLPQERILVERYLIDQEHSNAYTTWKKMGAPQSPTGEQYKLIEAAGQLQTATSPQYVNPTNGEADLHFDMQRQAVTLLKISW